MIKIKTHSTTSRPSTSLGKGDHIAKIDSVEPCYNTDNVKVDWTDKTPQIAVKYVSGGKYITQWITLRSYKTIEDDKVDGAEYIAHPISKIQFAVKDGRRVVDEERSKAGLLILAHVAHCSGIPDGSEIELDDLVGRELLIRVGQHDGKLKVIKTFKRK
jgi:hypothetical protein